MINEYEERFQRSLEKLLIPSWFVASKTSIPTVPLSIYRQSTHVHRPQSCRSSIATSRSPSIHSWHPNYIHERTHSSSIVPRSRHRYQKGIERVARSSQWYRPMQFTTQDKDDEKGREEKTSVMEKQDHGPHRHPSSLVSSFRVKKRIPSLELLPISCQTLNDDDNNNDDNDDGVRELSDDEDGLREIDEDEMNETDEFFLFPQTKANLNRLYTFTKNNEQQQQQQQQASHSLHRDLSIVDQTVPQTDENNDSDEDDEDEDEDDHNDNDDDNPSMPITDLVSDQISQSSISRSLDGVNEETARIGRLILNSISTEQIEPFPPISVSVQTDEKIGEYDEEYIDDLQHDSGYSSHQERLTALSGLLPPPSNATAIASNVYYEPLSDCYSGYSYIPSDFLPTTHQLSSIHSNTDEAYESEPTTMSSSIITTHVHPQLEHEFEYPSPPPPVPDRRLKPAYLKILSTTESVRYSTVVKVENNSTTKTRNSRDYCGMIPTIEDCHPSKTKEKRNHKTLNCLHSSTKEDKRLKVPLLTKSKTKKQQYKDFDEATNGLAIRLPASDMKPLIQHTSNGSMKKPSTTHVAVYETSV